MERYLVTQSLISAWNYLYNCFDGYQDDAYRSFLDTLNRVSTPPTEAMLNGIEFEREVYKCASGQPRTPHKKWESGINTVAMRVAGAQVQVKVQRECQLGDTVYLAYGVLDALKAGVIYDVKFSDKGFASAELAGKYFDSPQHPTYLYLVPEARKFIYLVSDGEDLYTEQYTHSNSRPFESILSEFIQSLKDMNLYDLYREKWLAL